MAPATRRSRLRALADRVGILSGYTAQDGTRRHTTDECRVALLAALGLEAASEAAAGRALAELDEAERAEMIAPVQVVRRGRRVRAALRLGDRRPGALGWEAELESEDGKRRLVAGRGRPRGPDGRLVIPLPGPLPPGYYRLRVRVRGPGGGREAAQLVVVTPGSCYPVRHATGGRRRFGILANLYAVRSARNWGAGNLTDLAELAGWAGELGAAFVGLNPLHAVRYRGTEVSPYTPTTRLFRSPLYLDVAAVPEVAEDEEVRGLLDAAPVRLELERLRASALVEYGGLAALQRTVLQAAHRAFVRRHRDQGTPRGRAYAAYLARAGSLLTDFATFQALEARHHGAPWPSWPAPLRDPGSEAVRAFREAHAEEIDFHRYLQFETERQLAEASARARTEGLALGLYHDLAVGGARDGFDTWAFPGLFVLGASVGAPPDEYSRTGQDWGLPPLHPRRLRADGYRYWILLLRAAFAHAGILRLDHAMGLLRQFWLAAGVEDGAYVRYPAADLLGILALESRRHRAVVVGEDLGTVPRGFSALLARWEILSTRVLYFERDRRGRFHPAARYSPRALVTARTHDHAPLAGYRCGLDLVLRWAAGQIASPAELARARAERFRQVANLVRRLWPGGVGVPPATDADFTAAVHGFLAATPAPLLGLALDDLAGEAAPVNLPAVPSDRYPNWRRRLTMTLEEFRHHPFVARALGPLGRRGAPRRAGGVA